MANEVKVMDRRRHERVAAAHPVRFFTPDGDPIGQGRTANVSATGIFVIYNARDCRLPASGEIVVEIVRREDGPAEKRRCRLARRQSVGHLAGIGLEFIDKP